MTLKESERKKLKPRLVSLIVFLATLVVVFISLTTVVFPTLVIRSLGGVEDYSGINPFETGMLAYPLLITNFILLVLGILYTKNRLPTSITNSIRFIFNFEVSAQVAFIVIIVLIGIYVTLSVSELFNGMYDADYYLRVKPWLENFSITNFEKNAGGPEYYLMLFLISTSMKVFGNDKVIPFISSIALLVLTYLITTLITKKRFAGIISMVVVLQSGTFLIYDTNVAYPNFWILFYLLSLYMIYKKWPVSPISFICSLFTKPLTVMFVPLTFFFIYRSSISRKKKILIAISYGMIIIIGIIAFAEYSGILRGTPALNPHQFWRAFNAISYQLRYDGLVLVSLLPLIVGLFIASRKGIAHADSIMVLIAGMFLSQPLLAAFGYTYSEPYRFIALIIFFAMGVGTILSKKVSQMT